VTDRIDELKQVWDERRERLGLTKRAVLFKRFPGWLNESIHRRHVRIVLDNCMGNIGSILDVGCGYGRISSDVAKRFPGARIQGVDLCTEFAKAFEKNIGPCFNGPIQEFYSDNHFDIIIIVTTLMYLNTDEHSATLQKLWSMLSEGGCIICIEPASEIFTLWRRLTGQASASPTGGNICHFSRQELVTKFARLDTASIKNIDSINLVPRFGATAIHHAVAAYKGQFNPAKNGCS